jgi:hypothetical protein
MLRSAALWRQRQSAVMGRSAVPRAAARGAQNSPKNADTRQKHPPLVKAGVALPHLQRPQHGQLLGWRRAGRSRLQPPDQRRHD